MTVLNPFNLPEQNDPAMRPYLKGFIERTENVATLVLYNGDPIISSNGSDDKKNTDYTDPDNLEEVDSLSTTIPKDKLDETKIVSNNIPKLVNDPEQGLYFGVFNNFSLIQVMEAKDQIVKLHQNFGDSWNLFFFGDTPSVYTFRGVFLDTIEYPYYQEFSVMYDRFLAGRKCVENGFKMKLTYDGKVIGGYLMNIQTVLSADTPHTKTFSFTVILTDENYIRGNARIVNGKFQGVTLNRFNNSHRVVKQYPELFSLSDQGAQEELPSGVDDVRPRQTTPLPPTLPS